MLQMSRGDPIFRSIEQARDVAAMAHDDERGREHAEHDVERWVAEYEREHRHERRRDDRTERYVARGEHEEQPDEEDDHRHLRHEHEDHAEPRRDALAAVKAQEERKRVSDDGEDAAEDHDERRADEHLAEPDGEQPLEHVEEEDQDMFSAIDVAAAKVLRQLRKYKTRVIDRKVRAGAHGDPGSIRTMEGEELDLDALMADLSADEEIVRVKEIEFAPMTEEEALIQIDLLGHDFFAYTDRDTEAVCVLYRRDDGGYGILKQKL